MPCLARRSRSRYKLRELPKARTFKLRKLWGPRVGCTRRFRGPLEQGASCGHLCREDSMCAIIAGGLCSTGPTASQSPRLTVAQTRRRCGQAAICQAVYTMVVQHPGALSRPSIRATRRAWTSERLTFRHRRRFPARLGEVRFSLTAGARDN